jgi:acetylglutamate kinase
MQALIGSGVASAGMIAKLRACADALAGGAAEVVLVDGRDPATLEQQRDRGARPEMARR